MKTVWHVISPADPVTEENGSAVQSVAKRLIEESNREGLFRSKLIAGTGSVSRDGVEALMPVTTKLSRAGDLVARYIRPFSRASSLRNMSKISQPDAIILHNQHVLIPSFKATFPNVPVYVYAHNMLWRGVPRAVARLIMRDVDGLICVSADLQAGLAERLGKLPRSTVLHSGVDFTDSEHGTPEWDVVFVGRTVPGKGVHVLLAALVELSRLGTFPRTLIVGSSWFYGHSQPEEYELRLRQVVRENRLNVVFREAVAPTLVPAILNSARISVVPSVWREPLGLTALEGMASHSALVFSGAGGMPEVASGGGMQFRTGDARDLAEVINLLLRDEALRQHIAQAGRLKAKSLTWRSAARALQDFLELNRD